MYKVITNYDNDYVYRKAYTVSEAPLYILNNTEAQGGYCKEFATFDIETSILNKGTDNAESFMYIWQFCIHDYIVIFGRTWDEFSELLARLQEQLKLCDSHKLVIYVHNLSYEYEFLRQFVGFKDVFATARRTVLRCSNDYFEFRCSYMLTNQNLKKCIENTPGAHYTKGADFVYNKLRTPKTELTPVEYGYCYNDVRGLYEAIKFKLKDDKLDTIPYTSTGFVRRACREAMKCNKKNRKEFEKTQLNVKVYELMKEAYRGGNTASNRYHTDETIKNVGSYDISSSYPYVIISKDFPIGKFIKCDIKTLEELEMYNNDYATVGRYSFNNMKLKKGVAIPYIPFAKCTLVSKPVCYNGRILEAENVQITLTNIDLEIILKQYDFEDLFIKDFYISRKGRLPKELINEVLLYFENKSKLKGIQGKEYEYLKAKELLNAIYGMMVTDPRHKEIYQDEQGEWHEEQKDTREELDNFYKSRNSFLPYQWGVWVSAHARKRLQQGLDAVGLDVIYCDTDSVKYIGNHTKDFERINQKEEKWLQANNIKYSVTVGKKVYKLGVWDSENQKGKEYAYNEFKTLGAKKYAFIKNNNIGVTVSGLSKKKGAETLRKGNGLIDFTDGKIFNENESGRTVSQYNSNVNIHYLNIDGEIIKTASNIVIYETTYTLGITEQMKQLLKEIKIEGGK